LLLNTACTAKCDQDEADNVTSLPVEKVADFEVCARRTHVEASTNGFGAILRVIVCSVCAPLRARLRHRVKTGYSQSPERGAGNAMFFVSNLRSRAGRDENRRACRPVESRSQLRELRWLQRIFNDLQCIFESVGALSRSLWGPFGAKSRRSPEHAGLPHAHGRSTRTRFA